MSRPALFRIAAVAAMSLALSGCISLFPKSKPSQLYRFGEGATAEAPPPTSARSVGVLRVNAFFPREAAGDRILTVTGGKAAYIAEARWVAPAQVLFDQAVLKAFDRAPGHVRLMSRGEPGSAASQLRLDVRTFETRYDAGPDAAPTVVVELRGALTRSQDTSLVATQPFTASVRAGDNRVGAIVAAYDQALADVLGKVTAWTDAQAR
jgi:cholesterol transport system auxiliary component